MDSTASVTFKYIMYVGLKLSGSKWWLWEKCWGPCASVQPSKLWPHPVLPWQGVLCPCLFLSFCILPWQVSIWPLWHLFVQQCGGGCRCVGNESTVVSPGWSWDHSFHLCGASRSWEREGKRVLCCGKESWIQEGRGWHLFCDLSQRVKCLKGICLKTVATTHLPVVVPLLILSNTPHQKQNGVLEKNVPDPLRPSSEMTSPNSCFLQLPLMFNFSLSIGWSLSYQVAITNHCWADWSQICSHGAGRARPLPRR